MARPGTSPLSMAANYGSTSRPENVNTVTKTPATGDQNESKETETTSVPSLDEAAAIPKGTIDPVYEAKARVLNHAVRVSKYPHVIEY
jgi:hypothetical protein